MPDSKMVHQRLREGTSTGFTATMAKSKVLRYAEFDLDTLLDLAGEIRNQPCACDVSQLPMSGSMNWATVLAFDDGVEWIFRSPHSGDMHSSARNRP